MTFVYPGTETKLRTTVECHDIAQAVVAGFDDTYCYSVQRNKRLAKKP